MKARDNQQFSLNRIFLIIFLAFAIVYNRQNTILFLGERQYYVKFNRLFFSLSKNFASFSKISEKKKKNPIFS